MLAHARALLTSTPEGVTYYMQADLNDPDSILREAARTLDFGKPVAVTLLGIMISFAMTRKRGPWRDGLLTRCRPVAI